jgi:hypothetical protein
MGKMDASIQGWYIDPAEVSICKRPEDGEDWLLGTGSYGKVGRRRPAVTPCFGACMRARGSYGLRISAKPLSSLVAAMACTLQQQPGTLSGWAAHCPPHAKLLPDQFRCYMSAPSEQWPLPLLQVYKALRGGVQDVAVKVLLAPDEEQLLQFEKVGPRTFISRISVV